MYNDDVTAVPKDQEHFWKMTEDNFEFARHVLEDYNFETQDEAAAPGRAAMSAIAFRSTSDELDQRGFYYEMGQALLPTVRSLIDRRELSIEKIQAWGKLMFCHGLLAGSIFDDSMDSTVLMAKNAAKSAESRIPLHRGWLANIYGLPQFAGIKREAADDAVAALMLELRDDPTRRSQYPENWFDKIITKGGNLRGSLDFKNFSLREMAELRNLGTDGLPPIPG